MPEGVTSHVDRDTASATVVVDAPAEKIFDFLRRPANHLIISGDHSVRGLTTGPEALANGDRFGMKMKLGLPYRIRSKVVEFEENRRIAWCHIGGHRWRWELEPTGDGQTKVTETFDMSTSRFPPALRLAGYPKGHEANVAASVANVRDHFAPGA
jgi:Polyketide cyclase / dehydrase and lipid transport